MKTYTYSDLTQIELQKLVQRNADTSNIIRKTVEDIIKTVKRDGDSALFAYSRQFDRVELSKLFLDSEQLKALANTLGSKEQEAIDLAYKNIYKFHAAQAVQESRVETTPGVECWRESRAIERVGLYVPGGTAVLPSTLLMLGIPARIAGCNEIVVCSPPQKTGSVNAALAYVATLLKIEKIYLTGGAQAIAAMAFGTRTIPKVDKIFGPGNQYVTKAKTILQSESAMAIDMPAGPSEVLIIADETCHPAYVAADMLAQAEHGVDSQAVLVATSKTITGSVKEEIVKQLAVLSRKDVAAAAIENSYMVIADDLQQAMRLGNLYAPEHLILATENWNQIVDKITNAGSVFLGNLSPESVGDYASGTNHTLPTSGYAKAYSGVSVDSFVKKITFQHLTSEGINNIGPAVEIIAQLEGLDAHKNAVTVRLTDLKE